MSEILQTLIAFVTLLFLVIFLALALSSALFHLRNAVPFVPTPRRITDAMIDLAQLKYGETVYDLGAGDGRVLERAMERVPGIRAVGYEGAYGVWLFSKVRHFFVQRKPTMLCKNFLQENLSDADVVFTYLGVEMMRTLQVKFEAELKPGTRVVSHAFSIHGWEPTETRTVMMPIFGKTNVYLYRR
jgi:hypothetical protein